MATTTDPLQTTDPLALPPVPPLGSTPTSVAQLVPRGVGGKGVHFSGPVVSGPPPASPLGLPGSALLAITLQLDSTMGNFSLPVQFPQDAILLFATAVEYQTFAPAAPSFSLGRQTGAADILAATALPGTTASAISAMVTGALPTWTDVAPLKPFQAWINVTANGVNTAGGGLITLVFARLARAWN